MLEDEDGYAEEADSYMYGGLPRESHEVPLESLMETLAPCPHPGQFHPQDPLCAIPTMTFPLQMVRGPRHPMREGIVRSNAELWADRIHNTYHSYCF